MKCWNAFAWPVGIVRLLRGPSMTSACWRKGDRFVADECAIAKLDFEILLFHGEVCLVSCSFSSSRLFHFRASASVASSV